MHISVIFFGRLAEIESNSISLQNVLSTTELIEQLQQKYPALANEKYIIAVDKKMVTGNVPLNEGSVVALLPPFSGG